MTLNMRVQGKAVGTKMSQYDKNMSQYDNTYISKILDM